MKRDVTHFRVFLSERRLLSSVKTELLLQKSTPQIFTLSLSLSRRVRNMHDKGIKSDERRKFMNYSQFF